MRIVGSTARLREAGARLESAGRRGVFVAAAERAFRRSVVPLREQASDHARAILPSGLGEVVAATPMPVTLKRVGRTVSARIDARPGRGKGGVNDPEAIDRGRVRHPVFGRWETRAGKDISQIQMVRQGWFRVPMSQGSQKVRADLLREVRSEFDRLT